MNDNQITWQGEPLDAKDENDRRFKKCLEIIRNVTREELVQLMGEDFLEEFKRVSNR
jgi:hypothetical protein